jgi:alpha-mannosidase
MKRYLIATLTGMIMIIACKQDIVNKPVQSDYKGPVTDIIVVFKMHFDIGYTQWAEGVLQQYSGPMLEKTLTAIDQTSDLSKSEQFVWTVPSWPLKYMLENCSPELKPRLEKAIKEERIIPHALPFTFETEASDLENLVRGLEYASEINRRFGLPLPREAKLTDVPSHSHILPTLLRNAGVDILHIGCNPGSASPSVPTIFWWEGTDGSKLLTFNWAEYYGSGIMPPKDWKHKTWLAMIHTHENTGAPTPEEVADLLKSAREQMPNAHVRIGRLSDFYDALMLEKPELPVVKGDMPDTWIHGYLSTPREIKTSKKLQRETFNTEILNTQIKSWTGVSATIDKFIDKAAENMILYDEHTFGVAITHNNQQTWSYGDDFMINKSLDYYSYAEVSWQEKANRIQTAERIVRPIMNQQLKQLASSVSVEGKRIVVYNPLPWPRSGIVNFFAGIYQKNFQIYGVKDTETGNIIPVYNDKNLVSFEAENIPATGYRTFIPVLEPINKDNNPTILCDERNNVIENRFFRLKIDQKTGALKSAFDKINNKEMVNTADEDGFAQFIYEQFGQEDLTRYNKAYVKPGSESWANQEMGRPSVPDDKRKVFKGICEKILYREMGNSVRASVFGKTDDPDGQRYIVNYTLYENQPYIEIDWGITGKRAEPNPEAGWLAFPFNLKETEYRLYRTGGIVDPKKDFIDRSNLDYCFLNTSMTMFDESGTGYAINTPSSPGISIGERGLYQFSGKKEPAGSKVYINLFNTQWGTNFAEWIEGSFNSRLFIWSYKGYDPEKSLITPTEETRIPLYATHFDGIKGNYPLTNNGLALSRKGILVTAYGKNRDGEGTILRLWEQSGSEVPCTVTLPSGSTYKRAVRCNLRGVISENPEIPVIEGKFTIVMKPNKPATFILK